MATKRITKAMLEEENTKLKAELAELKKKAPKSGGRTVVMVAPSSLDTKEE